jgi:predicted amidohydrolase YtcJ
MRPSLSALVVFLALLPAALAGAAPAATSAPADRVYRNGVIFTADARDSRAQALAVRDGRIVYVGSDQGLAPYVGVATQTIDLHGRFVMPGIVDGHMHPFEAGAQLLKCNLNYESLTVAEFQQRVQACLDATVAQEPDAWLEVVNWFQETMRPAGVQTSRETLDALRTRRPIIVLSSQGHTGLANSRALALAKITAATPDPVGGKLWRGAHGEPTGLL